jgi:hypothetical protein
MLLIRSLQQPKLPSLSRRPSESPLATLHHDDLVDTKLDFQLDGGEDSFVRGFEGLRADCGWVAGGHEDAVGGVDAQQVGERSGCEDGAVGLEEGGYCCLVGGHLGGVSNSYFCLDVGVSCVLLYEVKLLGRA